MLASGQGLADSTGIWLESKGGPHITELKDLVPWYFDLEMVHFKARPALYRAAVSSFSLQITDKAPVVRIQQRSQTSYPFM